MIQAEKTGLEYMNCNVCSRNDSELLFENIDRLHGNPGIFKVVRCRNCGLVYLNPRPRNISDYYPDDYAPYNVKQEDFFQKVAGNLMDAYYSNSLNIIVKLKSLLYKLIYDPVPKEYMGKILDIGCGNGIFLYGLKKYGWDVFGLDMSEQAVEFARKKFGLSNVEKGFFDDMNYPEESFDVITLNHVIEHLPDPANALLKINKLLKKNGLLIITTSNIDSFNFKLFKSKWFPLETPRHLNLFGHLSMNKILGKNGFSLNRSYYNISTDQLMRSVNYLFNRNIMNKSRLLFLPLMFFLSFFEKSDIVTFHAVKS